MNVPFGALLPLSGSVAQTGVSIKSGEAQRGALFLSRSMAFRPLVRPYNRVRICASGKNKPNKQITRAVERPGG
jgi:hypothetical protein